MSHVYENPVETAVDLIARILSVSVNIKKYDSNICTRTQRTFCVTCRITVTSQEAIEDYSKKLPLKYTAVERFDKYIKMINKLKYFSGWYFLST
jgi:uncharacterized metal-binding protein YceD (DUF177 family)